MSDIMSQIVERVYKIILFQKHLTGFHLLLYPLFFAVDT